MINSCKYLCHVLLKSLASPPLTVVERVPTQWTARATTRFEPLEQARAMERVPTRTAPLIRHLLVRTNNAVTNGTFGLSFERTLYVPPPCAQCVDQGSVEDRDSAERSAQPRLPLLLIDRYTVQTLDVRVRKRECRW
jgi:hypothetical protein